MYESSDLVKNDQDNNFSHSNIVNLDSIKVKRDHSSDIDFANKNMLLNH